MEKHNINGKARIAHEADGMTLAQIKSNAIKKWYLLLIFSVLFLGVAYFINKISQPRYKISSTVLYKNDSKVLEFFNVFQSQRAGKPTAIVSDQIGVIKSYTLNLKAAQNLDWQYSWYKNEFFSYKDLFRNDPFELQIPGESIQMDLFPLKIEVKSGEYYVVSGKGERNINGRDVKIEFAQRVAFGNPFKNDFFHFTLNKKSSYPVQEGDEFTLVFNNIAKLAHQYKNRIEVRQADENSNLMVIEMETEQLARDVEFLNKLASYYIQHGLDEKNRIANNTVRFIDNLIAGVNDSLQVAGNSFTDFRSKNRTVNLGAEATRIVDNLKDLDEEQSRLNLKLEYYTNLKYYLQNRDEIRDLVAPSLIGIRDDDMNSMVMKLNDLYTRREVLSYTVQEKNPTLIALNNEIEFTQKLLSEKVENQIRHANVERRNIQQQIQKVNSQLTRLPKTEQNLIGMKRNFDLNNELYTFLMQRRAEADIARASNSPDAQILDPASTSIAETLGPKKVKNYITAVLSAFILFMVVVVLTEYFSDKIKIPDDIAKNLDFPVIASITENKFKNEIPVLQYPKSAVTESFRGLRINLQSHFKNHQVLAVHSWISGEGKSFVATNLALVMAISNKRVLLIDGDLRKPRLHSILRPKNGKGLGDYLNGKANIPEIIHGTVHEGLHFIPAGTLPGNPAELLNNGLLTRLLDSLRDKFDYIVFDTPPFGVVSDGTMIGLAADINLFIVRLNYSLKENIEGINKVHHEGILQNVLVMANGLKQRAGYGYYNEDRRRLVDVKV